MSEKTKLHLALYDWRAVLIRRYPPSAHVKLLEAISKAHAELVETMP